ncbi:MAG TPA: hypothetical protein VF661_14290 [Actinomycetales bacterium]|jgi:hypothetical protein
MSHSSGSSTRPGTSAAGAPAIASTPLLAFSWLVVGVPLAYGVWQTLVKAAKLFTG